MSPDAVIVVLGTDSDTTYATYHYLNDRIGVRRLVLEKPVSRMLLLRRRVARLGLIPAVGQLAFQLMVSPLLALRSKGRIREIRGEFGLNISAVMSDAVIQVASVNAEDAIQSVQALRPALIVLSGTRILSRHFLECINCPVLNIHAGITPLYRGVHGAYWALAENRDELCGVTVHRVDCGIDTGPVLGQRRIQRTDADNFSTYPWIQLGTGLKLLVEILPGILEGRQPLVEPLVAESGLRHHPTLWFYLWNRLFHGVK